MRDMLKVQELMDIHLDQRDEELCQLRSQSQVDGAQLAALSMQVQELISSVEARAKVVGRGLEEINGWFDCHRGEINRLKIREKDGKEEVEKLKGFCEDLFLISSTTHSFSFISLCTTTS